MDIRGELDIIRRLLHQGSGTADAATRRRFWRVVGRIKRLDSPDAETIAAATEIRDDLYRDRLGRWISLKWLIAWLLCGAAALVHYMWLLQTDGGVTGRFAEDYRCGAVVAGAMFFLYPFGRLITGSLMGIRFDGISRDIYYLPTLKINYPSYLAASPPTRLWFFFFAGYWTAFTMISIGAVGYVLAGEWTAVAFGIVLGILETLGAVFGTRWGGELGHFHRELRIVRDWRNGRRR